MGALESISDLCSNGLAAMRTAASDNAPIVVLAEGRTDIEFLESALRLLYPHLIDLIRFMDFGQRPQGSAGTLANTAKAFAAAGVANRVVALFDNDRQRTPKSQTQTSTASPARSSCILDATFSLVAGGDLRPVQWSSYISGMRQYQGEIVDKYSVHDAYRAKIGAASADPSLIARQDWSGIRAILDLVIHAFG
jgi:hypothetical protein